MTRWISVHDVGVVFSPHRFTIPTRTGPRPHASHQNIKGSNPRSWILRKERFIVFFLRLYVLGTLLATITLYCRDDFFLLMFRLATSFFTPHYAHRPNQTSSASMTRHPHPYRKLSAQYVLHMTRILLNISPRTAMLPGFLFSVISLHFFHFLSRLSLIFLWYQGFVFHT